MPMGRSPVGNGISEMAPRPAVRRSRTPTFARAPTRWPWWCVMTVAGEFSLAKHTTFVDCCSWTVSEDFLCKDLKVCWFDCCSCNDFNPPGKLVSVVIHQSSTCTQCFHREMGGKYPSNIRMALSGTKATKTAKWCASRAIKYATSFEFRFAWSLGRSGRVRMASSLSTSCLHAIILEQVLSSPIAKDDTSLTSAGGPAC